MLNQALEIFRKAYETYGENLILDSYVPADGTYVIIAAKDDDFTINETADIKLDKKTGHIDETIQNLKFIRFADYYSKLLDMNKPIDSKKIIHSNNYLSFFIKKDSLVNGKLTEEIVDNYYHVLENPAAKYKKSKKASELYSEVEEQYGKVNKEKLNNIRAWIKKNVYSILENNSGKDYLKLFFAIQIKNIQKKNMRKREQGILYQIYIITMILI